MPRDAGIEGHAGEALPGLVADGRAPGGEVDLRHVAERDERPGGRAQRQRAHGLGMARARGAAAAPPLPRAGPSRYTWLTTVPANAVWMASSTSPARRPYCSSRAGSRFTERLAAGAGVRALHVGDARHRARYAAPASRGRALDDIEVRPEHLHHALRGLARQRFADAVAEKGQHVGLHGRVLAQHGADLLLRLDPGRSRDPRFSSM